MDTTSLSTTYRIYKTTIQRFPSLITTLNSHACYIIDNDKKNKIYLWIGKLCNDNDKQMSILIYNEMIKEPRYNKHNSSSSSSSNGGIGIGSSSSNGDNKDSMKYIIYDDIISPDLIGLLSLLCGNEEEYNKHYNARLQPYIILNSYKTLYCIDNNNNNNILRKIDSVSPNSNGHVPKLVFPLVSSSSIIVLLVGNQYDIWIGDNITKHDEDAAIELLINTGKDNSNNNGSNSNNNGSNSNNNGSNSNNNGSNSNNDGNSIIYHSGNNIRITREGYERVPFRSNFEPNIKFGYKLKKYKIIIDDDDDSNDVGCINIGAIADVMNISWITSYLERNSFIHQVNNNSSSSSSSSSNKGNDTTNKSNGIELQSFKTEQDISSLQLIDDAFIMKSYLNIDKDEERKLLKKFKEKPSHLVGWQIHDDNLGLGVVVDYHTSSYVTGRKQFAVRLDNDSPEIWITLSMDTNDDENKFTILRNVNSSYEKSSSSNDHIVI